MKTIAITIEEDIVDRLDRLDHLGAAKDRPVNRSMVVRKAVREYVEREERLAENRREAAIFKKNRVRLARQAEALVKSQAKA